MQDAMRRPKAPAPTIRTLRRGRSFRSRSPSVNSERCCGRKSASIASLAFNAFLRLSIGLLFKCRKLVIFFFVRFPMSVPTPGIKRTAQSAEVCCRTGLSEGENIFRSDPFPCLSCHLSRAEIGSLVHDAVR